VNDQREQDEFERIKLHQDVERARLIIEQYETGTAFYRQEIENTRYKLGRLDERLGDGS
jgi:hypothetical protein